VIKNVEMEKCSGDGEVDADITDDIPGDSHDPGLPSNGKMDIIGVELNE